LTFWRGEPLGNRWDTTAAATGEVTELVVLAHDMYLLQKVNRLPESLVNRLRNYG